MTDNEIIKEATEAYNQNLGAGCYVGDLLGIISRQNAEIERLQKDLDIINAANTELYGAFEENERLKSEIEVSKSQLIRTIKEDCAYWDKITNEDKLFKDYLYLNECSNSEISGMYQLMLNGCELWFGTLPEINAIVKSMITAHEKNNFRE